MANVPQRPFFTTQDIINLDVDLLYSKIIKDIDMFRSRFDGTTSNLARKISAKNLDAVFATNEMNSISPQESRCSAFFRMIGFPVVAGNGSALYSPGFDPDANRNVDATNLKLGIADTMLGKFREILDARENYPKNSATSFKNKDNNSSALGISSIYPRPFDKQLKPGLGPLEIDNQEFEVPDRSRVLDNFSDPVMFNTFSTHILKPFMVDPRIDFTVTPATNRICVPFLNDKSKTQLTRSTYLKRPYIEKVISIRFNNTNVIASPQDQKEVNQYVQQTLDFVKNNSSITDPGLVELVSDALKSLHKSELIIFDNFLKILGALLVQLVQATTEIDKIRTKINWKPIPNIGGPEFGSVLNDIDPSDKQNNKEQETNIFTTQINQALNTTDFDIGMNQPDLGGFSFSNIDDIVFDSLKNTSTIYDDQLSKLNKRRNEMGNRANALLRRIEIITGEFSGLGLLDIIAMQAAFWVMSPDALLGMIDAAAFGRMQANNNLKTDSAGKSPIPSLTEYETKLSEIYVLINAMYLQLFNPVSTK